MSYRTKHKRALEHKPASSLPFSVCESDDSIAIGSGDTTILPDSMFADYSDAEIATIRSDYAYLVHAGNVYPDVVEFLRGVAARVPANVNGDGPTEGARALLRAMGEA